MQEKTFISLKKQKDLNFLKNYTEKKSLNACTLLSDKKPFNSLAFAGPNIEPI